MLKRYGVVLGLVFLLGTPVLAQEPSPSDNTITAFDFRDGRLGFGLIYVTDPAGINRIKEYPSPRCYGRTYFFDTAKGGFIDDVNGEFTGRLAASREKNEGEWSGKVKVTLQPMLMRYTMRCNSMSRTIEVRPGDWPSDQKIRSFPSLKNAAPIRKTQTTVLTKASNKNKTRSVSTQTTEGKIKKVREIYSVSALSTGFKARPGDTNVVVGRFDIRVNEPIRIASLSFKLRDPKNSPLTNLTMYVDGQPADSHIPFGEMRKNNFGIGGLSDMAVVEKLNKGVHHVVLKANLKNPGTKKVLTDSLTVQSMKVFAGAHVDVSLKSPVTLGAFTIKYRSIKPGTKGSASEVYADQK